MHWLLSRQWLMHRSIYMKKSPHEDFRRFFKSYHLWSKHCDFTHHPQSELSSILHCCWVAKSCRTLCNPIDCSTPGSSVLHCLLEFAQIHVHWVSDSILCHPLLLLPSIFPSIRVFSRVSWAVHIRWPKYWSFSISPSNECQDWFPLGLTGLISLQFKGLSRVFSSTTVQKHQFFRAQTSLWSNFYISTWLLEKPQLWLYGPLLATWCLCFLIYCWDLLSRQELVYCHVWF